MRFFYAFQLLAQLASSYNNQTINQTRSYWLCPHLGCLSDQELFYLFALAFNSWLYLQMRKSWEAPAAPTKKLTANRLQFFGIITSEYLDQINPVAINTADCPVLSFSAGLAMSANPAHTNPHFIIGAQKKTVLGPAGWLYNGLNFSGRKNSTLSRTRW